MANENNLVPREARYGENKDRRTVSVTPTAWRNIEKGAAEKGVSVSEFIELIGRKALSVKDYKEFMKMS